MKKKQLTIPDLTPRCLNPKCKKPMQGKRPHAKTCSPACRKALWRYSPTPKYLPPAKVKQIAAKKQMNAATLRHPPRDKGGR